MASWNNFLLVMLTLLMIFFLWKGRTTSAAKESVSLMTGIHRLGFYLGVVSAGIAAPFILGAYLAFSDSSAISVLVPFSIILALLGLYGSYVLRYLVIKSGTCARLAVQGETVALPETARVPASERVQYH
jgi:hypothetical protein